MINGLRVNKKKIGLHGKIYDFVVDYEQITGTTKILDMHRYLINKHSVISKTCIKVSYYPPYRSSSNNFKVELDIDLSNYATKDDVKKVEDKVDENKKEMIFVRGFILYKYHSDLVYDCKLNLIKTNIYGILDWNPKNIYDPSNKNMLNGVQNKFALPIIKNDGKGLHVFLRVTILYKIL